MLDEVERELRDSSEGEVPSNQIGEKVMEKLQALDQVAYVRFASVYRQFADLGSFLTELQTMVNSKEKDLDK